MLLGMIYLTLVAKLYNHFQCFEYQDLPKVVQLLICLKREENILAGNNEID